MSIKNIAFVFILFFLVFSSNAQIERSNLMVGSSFTIHSKIMNDDREIQVFLPDSYTTSNKRYPVLYILDGQRYFLHGVSLQKSFVEFRQASEFIVVGISKKKSERNRNFSVDSKKFLEFLKKETIDFMDQKFRTSKERLLFGWAYGGGFVLETMTTTPDLFDAYIAASPFPLTTKINKVDSLLTHTPTFDTLLYFTSGSDEGVVKNGTRALNTLLTHKAPKTMNWTFRELQGEQHRSTPFTTLYHGIKEYFHYYPELQFSSLEAFTKAGGLPYVYEYYKERATQFGFSSQLTKWTMFTLTRNAIRANDYTQFDTFVNAFKNTKFIGELRVSRACSIAEFYAKNKHYEKAIALFTYLNKLHPDAERPLNGLGNAYKALKNDKKAATYFKKASEVSAKKN